MKRRFGDGPVSRLLSALFDLVMINLLLIVCSLPLFTAGAAACGAFMAVRSVLQDGRSSAVGTFFSGFRENFRQAAYLRLGSIVVKRCIRDRRRADRLAVISGGVLLAQGTPEEIYASGVIDKAFQARLRRAETPDGPQYYFA